MTGHACSNEVHRVPGQKTWPKSRPAPRRRLSPEAGEKEEEEKAEKDEQEESALPPELPHR